MGCMLGLASERIESSIHMCSITDEGIFFWSKEYLQVCKKVSNYEKVIQLITRGSEYKYLAVTTFFGDIDIFHGSEYLFTMKNNSSLSSNITAIESTDGGIITAHNDNSLCKWDLEGRKWGERIADTPFNHLIAIREINKFGLLIVGSKDAQIILTPNNTPIIIISPKDLIGDEEITDICLIPGSEKVLFTFTKVHNIGVRIYDYGTGNFGLEVGMPGGKKGGITHCRGVHGLDRSAIFLAGYWEDKGENYTGMTALFDYNNGVYVYTTTYPHHFPIIKPIRDIYIINENLAAVLHWKLGLNLIDIRTGGVLKIIGQMHHSTHIQMLK